MPNASQVYRSTRSSSPKTISFEEAIIQGLATDGGLFIPPTIPQVDQATLFNDWSELSFQDLAFAIMRLYIAQEEIPDADLKDLIKRSYSTFRSDEVTPLVQNVTGDKENLHILELFHGPTYAFKDVALQFVGNLLNTSYKEPTPIYLKARKSKSLWSVLLPVTLVLQPSTV